MIMSGRPLPGHGTARGRPDLSTIKETAVSLKEILLVIAEKLGHRFATEQEYVNFVNGIKNLADEVLADDSAGLVTPGAPVAVTTDQPFSHV